MVSRPEPFSAGELAALMSVETDEVCARHVLVAAIARLAQRVLDLEARIPGTGKG